MILRYSALLAVLGVIGFVGHAVAQTGEIPPNTISCSGFTKEADGEWFAHADNPYFDLGSVKHIKIRNGEIEPRSMRLGGHDLYAVLEAKCGKGK